MTSEHLLDAMGLLDDDLIQEAETYRPVKLRPNYRALNQREQRRQRKWRRLKRSSLQRSNLRRSCRQQLDQLGGKK